MKRTLTTLVLMAAAALSLLAQDKVTQKVLELGRTDNRVMAHADYISNNIGGRLIGTRNLLEAEAWVKSQFESWGLEVMEQEVGEIQVGFERGPWSGRMLSEDGMQLHFGTPAYTAGTKGPQKGKVLLEPMTQQQFDKIKGALKGAWVLVESGPTNGLAIDASAKADSTRAANLAAGEKASVPFYRQMVEAGVLGLIHETPGRFAVPVQP